MRCETRITMYMSQQKEILSTINGLIETLKDGQEGFRQASEAVRDFQLKMLLGEYSLQRAKFAGELQNEAINLGEHNPETSSSTAGALHRAWINLKSAITSHDEHAILAECERGEDTAVNEYKKAMAEDDDEAHPDLPPSRESKAEAEYTLESPVRCPACGERMTSIKAVRLIRAQVNFTSTLPRRGRVMVCPHCLAVIPAELTNF